MAGVLYGSLFGLLKVTVVGIIFVCLLALFIAVRVMNYNSKWIAKHLLGSTFNKESEESSEKGETCEGTCGGAFTHVTLKCLFEQDSVAMGFALACNFREDTKVRIP